MKKILIFVACCVIGFAGVCVAEEEILMPSSFDENKMILKRKDENGNFVPVDDSAPTMKQNAQNQPNFQKPTPVMMQKKNNVGPSRNNVPKWQQKKENAAPVPNQSGNVKKYKKVHKQYTMPKKTLVVPEDGEVMPSTFNLGQSTFDVKIDRATLPSHLPNETMQEARKALQEEQTVWVECKPDEKGCQEMDERTITQ